MKNSKFIVVFLLIVGISVSCKKPAEFNLTQQVPELIGKWEWFKTEFRLEFSGTYDIIETIDNDYWVDIKQNGSVFIYKNNNLIEELSIYSLNAKQNVQIDGAIYVYYSFLIEQITETTGFSIYYNSDLDEINFIGFPFNQDQNNGSGYNFYKRYE